jgi:hypothetical protein
VAFTQFGGETSEVYAKAAGFNDGDLDAERYDLFGQRLRETLNAELRGRVRCAPCRPDASCDLRYLDDVSGSALTKVGEHGLGHDDQRQIGWSQPTPESRRVTYLREGTRTRSRHGLRARPGRRSS